MAQFVSTFSTDIRKKHKHFKIKKSATHLIALRDSNATPENNITI